MAIEKVQFNPTLNHPWTPMVEDIIAETLGLPETERQDSGIMADHLAPSRFNYRAFTENGEFLGFNATSRVRYRGGLHLKIQHLGVIPERRNQGLGALILDDMVQSAKRMGASALRVYPQKAAMDFYRNHGFARRPDVDIDDLFKVLAPF